MRIVLLGPPGSGRRTLARKLASHFGLAYINLNEILSHMARDETELARLVGELLAACAPVPEELVASALRSALAAPEAFRGFIIDDYPRDTSHADTLDNILNSLGMPIDVVIALTVDSDDLMERLVGKLTCDACGAEYNIYTNPPMVEGVCDMCGGRIARRPTDYEETISNRLRVYEGHVQQLVDRYRSQGILHELRGTGEEARTYAASLRIVEKAPRREVPVAGAAAATGAPAARGRAARGGVAKKAPRAAVSGAPASGQAAPKKAAPKKAAPKGAVPKKAAPKKAVPKKAAPKKAVPKKAVPKKAVPKKAVPKKAAPKKAVPKKAAPKKAAPKKAAPKKAAPKKAAPKKAASRETVTKKRRR